MAGEKEITSVLNERRLFKPKKEFSKQAHLSSFEAYQRLYRKAEKDPEAFWAGLAKELAWFKPWKKVLEWKAPFAKWFLGGKINIAYNCLDRHLEGWRKNKAAIIWEGEPGDSRVLTYQDLHREVCKFANVLKAQGIVKGDRVAIYMPMIPELAIAMLACARIGATHSIIFGGFSSTALRDRINDAEARLVVTADGGYRKGEVVTLKEKVDEALKETPTVQKTITVRRTNTPVQMQPDRDLWWHDLMKSASDQCSAEALDSEHPLFILYTSGTTGKPKGVVHTTAGYLLGTTVTARWIFDLKETDTYWCTADIGWVTGHSYVIYGILSNGVTTVMYEGAPTYPQPDRLWEIIDKYKVNILYTAPTAIRALIKMGEEWPKRHDLSSLRLLGTVGEPINPEAWMWYHQVIGKGRCPIVDTWWQTETGGIMITPLPGAIPTKPGSATLPFPGIAADVVNREGKSVPANVGGYLVIRRPWPSMLRTVWKDPERYKKQYWSDIPGMYFTGDGARRDKDGYFWVMGRVDDVINVAGHRLGTMEIESALVSHVAVAEAAVVGRPDELKGTAISAFVTLEIGNTPSDQLKADLRAHVVKEIGAIARPDDIRFTENLPKTRSGKIMRRLLRDIAAGRETLGDTTTLEDYTVLAKLRQEEE
ncbi:MAG: acetate--CoA ligase [Candidatus Manganitrophaceae bacterium]|nr:MAG: acetate--CoA ligase [Candidatus Manganitrophaceae bacterium]